MYDWKNCTTPGRIRDARQMVERGQPLPYPDYFSKIQNYGGRIPMLGFSGDIQGHIIFSFPLNLHLLAN